MGTNSPGKTPPEDTSTARHLIIALLVCTSYVGQLFYYELVENEEPTKAPNEEQIKNNDMVRKYIDEIHREIEKIKNNPKTPPSHSPPEENRRQEPKKDIQPSGCRLIRCEPA